MKPFIFISSPYSARPLNHLRVYLFFYYSTCSYNTSSYNTSSGTNNTKSPCRTNITNPNSFCMAMIDLNKLIRQKVYNIVAVTATLEISVKNIIKIFVKNSLLFSTVRNCHRSLLILTNSVLFGP